MTNEKMTINDAIELLKDKRFEINCKVNGTTQFSKALEMAIRALEVVQGMEEVFLQELPELDMRDATEEERSSLKRYIDSISQSTGVKFDFNGVKTELEPCKDCVSREAAINVIYDYTYKKDMRQAIEQLPSVKPQRPKGEWIEQNDTSKHHFGWYYCSNCGAYLMSADGANYCSCCGAEMEGSNE